MSNTQLGVRWNKKVWDATLASSGTIWYPEQPVPIVATRFPAGSKSDGHRAVWKIRPLKEPAPLKTGMLGRDRNPTQLMTALARSTRRPSGLFATISHSPAFSSQLRDWTSVSQWMCPRTSKLSAIQLRYSSFAPAVQTGYGLGKRTP